MNTYRATAEKETPETLRSQADEITAIPILCEVLDTMLNLVLILNSRRQIIFANKAAVNMSDRTRDELLGMRCGDLFGCMHAVQGCGTTEFCEECDGNQAVAAALAGGRLPAECNIMSAIPGQEKNLLVYGAPFRHGGMNFALLVATDASDMKRRQALERIFFHDLINTAGSLRGIVSLMMQLPQEMGDYLPQADNASRLLMDQILSHRDLAAAERGDIKPQFEKFSAEDLLAEMRLLMSAHETAAGKTIVQEGDCAGIQLFSDRMLLGRVLGNMMKNALEAEPAGAKITLSCRREGGSILLSVHNPTPMDEKVRLRLFQRAFSTKGPGRGLGTYSIRLLSEKYLCGKVSADINQKGNTFTLAIPA